MVTIAHILCPVDLSPPSADGLRSATELSAVLGADDALTRLWELGTQDMRARCSPEVVLWYGEPGDELLHLLQERDADICVLAITRRSAVDLAVFGSTARRVIRDSGRQFSRWAHPNNP